MFGAFDVTFTQVPLAACSWCVDESRAGVAAPRSPAGAFFPPIRVAGDDVVATRAPRPDGAELVDQVVVANVAPAARDRVEVIDGADRGGDVAAAVIGDGVMDDRLLHALVLGGPFHQAL